MRHRRPRGASSCLRRCIMMLRVIQLVLLCALCNGCSAAIVAIRSVRPQAVLRLGLSQSSVRLHASLNDVNEREEIWRSRRAISRVVLSPVLQTPPRPLNPTDKNSPSNNTGTLTAIIIGVAIALAVRLGGRMTLLQVDHLPIL